MQRQYSRSASSGSSSENLPPRTLARIAREVRDLHKNTPEGIKLTFDGDSGGSLGELMVSLKFDFLSWWLENRGSVRFLSCVSVFWFRWAVLLSVPPYIKYTHVGTNSPNSKIVLIFFALIHFCSLPIIIMCLPGWDWRPDWHALWGQMLSTQVGSFVRLSCCTSKRSFSD